MVTSRHPMVVNTIRVLLVTVASASLSEPRCGFLPSPRTLDYSLDGKRLSFAGVKPRVTYRRVDGPPTLQITAYSTIPNVQVMDDRVTLASDECSPTSSAPQCAGMTGQRTLDYSLEGKGLSFRGVKPRITYRRVDGPPKLQIVSYSEIPNVQVTDDKVSVSMKECAPTSSEPQCNFKPSRTLEYPLEGKALSFVGVKPRITYRRVDGPPKLEIVRYSDIPNVQVMDDKVMVTGQECTPTSSEPQCSFMQSRTLDFSLEGKALSFVGVKPRITYRRVDGPPKLEIVRYADVPNVQVMDDKVTVTAQDCAPTSLEPQCNLIPSASTLDISLAGKDLSFVGVKPRITYRSVDGPPKLEIVRYSAIPNVQVMDDKVTVTAKECALTSSEPHCDFMTSTRALDYPLEGKSLRFKGVKPRITYRRVDGPPSLHITRFSETPVVQVTDDDVTVTVGECTETSLEPQCALTPSPQTEEYSLEGKSLSFRGVKPRITYRRVSGPSNLQIVGYSDVPVVLESDTHISVTVTECATNMSTMTSTSTSMSSALSRSTETSTSTTESHGVPMFTRSSSTSSSTATSTSTSYSSHSSKSTGSSSTSTTTSLFDENMTSDENTTATTSPEPEVTDAACGRMFGVTQVIVGLVMAATSSSTAGSFAGLVLAGLGAA